MNGCIIVSAYLVYRNLLKHNTNLSFPIIDEK